MPERTDHPTPQPSTPTSGNRIIDEPATPAACAKDYEAGAIDRHSSEQRDAKARR
ncbi:hypothetical protein ACIRF8_12785 [Streptomyces sp. NPDC102406]|uniref:hypothetical protein n=1 Tax=Streptomyces sp. NPDC102406 TaxID=3366171 RepID=UPI0037F113B8